MTKKIVWLILSCLMVAALLLASCGPAAEEEEEVVVTPGEEEVVVAEEEVVVTEEMVRDSLGRLVEKPKYGGDFTIVSGSDVLGFDEAIHANYACTTTKLTNEELLTGDWKRGPAGTGEIGWVGSMDLAYDYTVGGVAESWEIVDDRTVRFKIRKGIHFALNPGSEASQLVGGREMNAHDVVYSLRRHFLTPGCYMQVANTAEQKEGWDAYAEDDWTVIHQWNPAMAPVIFEYSDYCAIIAKEVIDEYGDMQDWRRSHGTGPFMLVDHVEMSSTTFVRNPNYWQKHPLYPEDTMPYLDGIKMLVIPDRSTRISALRTGKVGALGASWEDAEDIMKTNPELEYTRYLYATSPISLRMDNPDLPWYDKRVRHALALAINNQEIADEYYGGHADIYAHPLLPYPEYKDFFTPLEELPQSSRELYEYHPDKAKQLLAEAGYPDGFSCKVLCTSGGVDMLSVIKDYWVKIGVDLQIDVRDYAVFTSMYARKKQEEMIYGTPGSGANQPGRFFSYYSVGYLNYCRIDDPRVNEVIETVGDLGWDLCTDRERYAAIMEPIYPYIIDQQWQIALPGTYAYTFWWPWLKDYHGVSLVGFINVHTYLAYVWMDQDLKEEMGY